MPGIFINYRREDSGGYAQQIYRPLRSAFGADFVFMDLDTIRSGEDYRAIIHNAIAHSNVLLAVIGRSWLRCVDDKGIPRLSNPNDLVRREIAQALEAGIRVIPVLVGHAQMPRPTDLPDDLKTLAARNAHELPDHFFDQAVRQLIREIRKALGGQDVITRRRILWGVGGTVAAGLTTLAVLDIIDSGKPTPEQKAASADTTKYGQIQSLIDDSARQPNVVIRKPQSAEALPPAVPGPWKIDRIDFSSQVTGPRQEPKAVWVAHVSIGDAWSMLGFAPDKTLFLFDQERQVVCAIRDGLEQWARYIDDVVAITSDGRIFGGAYSMAVNPDAFTCFNSRGEGGNCKKPVRSPENRISLSKSYPAGRCDSDSFTVAKTAIPLDGNCSAWAVAQDDRGHLYTGTDHGTLYCFDVKGNALWSFKAEVELRDPPVFSLGDAVFGVKEHLVCVRNGAQRWSLPLKDCRPCLVDKAGTIFVLYEGPDTLGYRSHDILAAVDHDGHLLWNLPTPGTPTIFDPEGRLYLADPSRNYILCLA